MAIEVKALAIARAGVLVLENLSFVVNEGGAVLVRGPNGVGKTTLLRCLAGLQQPVQGQITCDSETIAYTSHLDGTKSALTVAENLEFWRSVYATGSIDQAVSSFNLTRLLDRPAGNLSAGQRRRVGLARLLVTGRKNWILDEPTVSLDDASVELFATVVRAHLRNGGSAVIATHIALGLDAESLDLAPFRVGRKGAHRNVDPFEEVSR